MFFSHPLTTFLKVFAGSAACEETRSIIPQRHNPLLYSGFEARRGTRRVLTECASLGLQWQLSTLRCMRYLGNPFTQQSESVLSAALTMSERFGRDYAKPLFGIDSVTTSEGLVSVRQRAVCEKAFGSLLHFQRDTRRVDPKVLLVAPMSGHYATLLRDTVRTLLVDHEVYLTDWHNARDIPSHEGSFGFEDYTQYVVDFLSHLGPSTHLMAVCQPTVACLVATAHMEEVDHPCRPASLTLMAGPLDTQVAPTEVTKFAESQNIEWFEQNVIAKVPSGYRGAGRLVYPGFLQLTAFLAMNPKKHLRSHWDLFGNLVKSETELSEKTSSFYDEYLAVCDLPARFYLETVDRVFLRRDLANGSMRFAGRTVDPSAIKRVPLLTVEGENDDISAPGQTLAGHTICSALAPEMRFHYLQSGVGHYGVFSGRRWRQQIAPRITSFIRNFSGPETTPPLSALELPNMGDHLQE